MVYRFRVTQEDHEDVYRDIEIKSSQSFIEFHTAIQQAIGFDNSKSASFYSSDDYWRKEKVIASENTNSEKIKKAKVKTAVDASNGEGARKKKTIADYIDNPHQKFVYVFDPEKEWTFLIELLKIIPADIKTTYPKCIKSIGTSPKQYKETNLPLPVPEEVDKPKKIVEEDIPLVLEKEPIDEEAEPYIPLNAEGEEEIILEESEEGVEVKGETEESTPEDEEGESSDGFEFDDDEKL